MIEEIIKPFGFSDTQGFYTVHSSNILALETARNVVATLPDQLEYMALSGYRIRDYPEGTPDKDFDWKYHLLVGVDSQLPMEKIHNLIFFDVREAVGKAYQKAREASGTYWHHGPLKTLPLDQRGMDLKVKSGNLLEFIPRSFLHSAVFSAVPLWEKPDVSKDWKGHRLTPFEYLQQFIFQFKAERAHYNSVYHSQVTGDEAARFVMD